MREWMIPAGLIAIIVGLCTIVVVVAHNQSQQWDAFKVEHKCVAVAHIDGTVFNTVGVDAKGGMVVGIGSTPSKTGWACDDGVTYYR